MRRRGPDPAAPEVPASAADPAAVRELAALSYDPVREMGAQRAASDRWLVHRYRFAAYDGSLAVDREGFARDIKKLEARWDPGGDDIGVTRSPEAQVAAAFAAESFRACDEVRMVAVASGPAASGEGTARTAVFVSRYGEASYARPQYPWLVARWFGGWDAATQRTPLDAFVFWRGGRPVAFVGAVALNSSPHWAESAAGLPAPTPPHDGPLPHPAPPRWPSYQEDPLGDLTHPLAERWVGEAVGAIVSAAGGVEVAGYGYLLATRAGPLRAVVTPPRKDRSHEWVISWGFEEPRLARAVGVKFAIGGDGHLVDYGRSAEEAVAAVQRRVASVQLRPEDRPPPALLAVHDDHWARRRGHPAAWPEGHRAAWVDGRWAVARIGGDGSFDLLRGAYGTRERAAWVARRLDLGAALRKLSAG